MTVGGVGFSVVMADRDGVVLERRGSPCDDATFQSSGLWTGAVWSENYEGTNAIGTCLVEKRMLTIHRDQHFLARNAMLSCTTAPIFDETGHLAAALDVSSCRADFTEGFIQLIMAAVAEAARRIEADNFRLAFPSARIVLAPTGTGDINALLAIDRDDLVIGATRAARRSLGLIGRTGRPHRSSSRRSGRCSRSGRHARIRRTRGAAACTRSREQQRLVGG